VKQSELAREMGITPQFLWCIEKGKRGPGRKLLARISERFGVSLDYLVFGSDAPKAHARAPKRAASGAR
jgi:transcriptional regulator with XRE-family HTH domain